MDDLTIDVEAQRLQNHSRRFFRAEAVAHRHAPAPDEISQAGTHVNPYTGLEGFADPAPRRLARLRRLLAHTGRVVRTL